MNKKILINASQAGEVWATLIENDTLEEILVESSRKPVLRGNIYRAHVALIDPKLKAAFVDYGADRNGFLSLKDINISLYPEQAKKAGRNANIQDVLKVGQP